MKTELFNVFIISNNLSEPKFIGQPFTWCNNQRGGAKIWARLDRVIVNHSWHDSIASYVIKHLARNQSDHCPIVMQTKTYMTKGKRPFRFVNNWAQSNICKQIVKETWSPLTRGNPMQQLNHKFCKLQKELIKNCGKINKDMEQKIQQVENEIIEIEKKHYQQHGDINIENKLRCLYNKQQALIRQNATLWAQKSRVQWLQDGDSNTKFFHQVTKNHRAHNRINHLLTKSQQIITEFQDIDQEFTNFYSTLWDPGKTLNVENLMNAMRMTYQKHPARTTY
ncbi:hypothetical protein J5N97_029569 [Dioscorea zingiberensis]|uniref:Uncharacterized protein n=1 Tax=Dioscorea zingiberensis TaxID=325984 RepID=A0A9D5C0L8_9LILI|nr:hypothetical protein J5N97_029569 [Dioscorea zingiberensis]